MVTITEVSKRARVSPSTVSKVINNYPNITEKTRAKVQKAIAELHYVPNMMASALSSKNYNRVAVWINFNDLGQSIDEINMQYIHGAFSKGNELGLNLMPIFSTMFDHKTIHEMEQYLKSEGITGVVIYGLNKNSKNLMQLIDKQEFSFVAVDAPTVNVKTSSVMVDHFKGQYEVAKTTIKSEFCKKILYFAGKEDGFITDIRLAAMEKLVSDYNLEMKVMYADFSEKKARELTFLYGEEYHIIICASDLMAIGAKSALKEMDIFRPVCGYDGISLMGYAGEGMYTCKQDFSHVSKVAITEMNRLLSGKKGRSILLDFNITRLEYGDIII